MTEDFSNHPVSITEAKADRDGNAATWTCRDALITALRDIDSGKVKPDQLALIVYAKDDESGEVDYHYYNRVENNLSLRGLYAKGLHWIDA